MSEIRIEPKPRRSALPFVLGLLLVVAIAVAVWYFMERSRSPEPGDAQVAPMTAPPPARVDTSSGG
jgi:hypothetical protein